MKKKLEEMDSVERAANWLDGKGLGPFYEEDMDLDYWRKKRRLIEQIEDQKGID